MIVTHPNTVKVSCHSVEMVGGRHCVVLTVGNLQNESDVEIVSAWLQKCVEEKWPGATTGVRH
jgi:hypothetical protein